MKKALRLLKNTILRPQMIHHHRMEMALMMVMMVMMGTGAGAREIRVMTYNVRHCTGLKGDLNLPRTAAVIEKYAPDFVALQELDSCAMRSRGLDELRLLGEQTLMRPTYAAAISLTGIDSRVGFHTRPQEGVEQDSRGGSYTRPQKGVEQNSRGGFYTRPPEKAANEKTGRYGVGLLSKQTPLSVKRIKMPSRDEDRVLLVCEFDDVVVGVTHLSLLQDERPAMVDTIINEAARWNKPFIVMGDLNAHPDSPEIKKLGEAFQILNSTKTPTFPADKPNEVIDYVAIYKTKEQGWGASFSGYGGTVKNGAAKRGAWVIEDSVSSDHRPVIVDLTLKTPAKELMTTPPYLQDARPNRMTVYFQTNKVCHTWIEYGTDSIHTHKARTLLDGQEECYRTDNHITLDSLKPATKYYYRVCAVEMVLKRSYETWLGDTVKTRFYSFRTPSDDQTDFTVLLFNDLHQHKQTYDSLLALVKGVDYDFVIFNGDCLPEPSDYKDAVRMIHNCADPVDGAEKPILFLRGNHEIRNFYSAGMHHLIGYPDGLTYGAFNVGDTRFVCLDLGEDKPDSTPVYAGLNDFTALRNRQTAFLKKELRSRAFKKAGRRVLVSHIPVFGNTDEYRPCTALWGDMLKDQPFDFYYCAHTHELRYFPDGVDGCSFPVLNGGGPRLNESAVSILQKRGDKLHLRTLTPKGVFKDVDL